MIILGVMLSENNEIELKKIFNEEIGFIDDFSDVFDKIKSKKPDVVVLDGDKLNYDKLIETIEKNG